MLIEGIYNRQKEKIIHRLQAGYLHLFIDTYPWTERKTWWRTGEIGEEKGVKK